MSTRYRLLTFYPHSVLDYGIGHAALSIITAMRSDTLDVLLVSPSSATSKQSPYQKDAVPVLLSRIFYKLKLPQFRHSLAEHYFLRQLQTNDIAYLWPGTSLNLYRKIKAKGNIIVTESINCHQQSSKQILDDEEKKLGLVNTHLITEQAITEESDKLALSDFIFSPSSLVTESLLDAGVAQPKILQSSYGLHSYQQLDKSNEATKPAKPVTAIFVGRVGMRKGIHLLLDYWTTANIKGTLKIIGNIEDSIQDLLIPYQNIENIQFVSFVDNIKKVYMDADIFVLPSLEEGSPLVTYLALGAGLPCIVSPMAGAGVITDGKEGFIIEPHDKEGWVTSLQKLFSSVALRKSQAEASMQTSDNFLWENVGRRRRDLLLDKLQGK